MDFLSWEWETTAMGILGIVGLALTVRLLRKGLGSYAQSRVAMDKRIDKTNAEIRESNLTMSLRERFDLLEAVLGELLALAGNPPGCSVERRSRDLLLRTPAAAWRIVLSAKTKPLRSMKRTLHGEEQWEVREMREGEERGAQSARAFHDLTSLTRHLDALIRSEGRPPEDSQDIDPQKFRRHIIR